MSNTNRQVINLKLNKMKNHWIVIDNSTNRALYGLHGKTLTFNSKEEAINFGKQRCNPFTVKEITTMEKNLQTLEAKRAEIDKEIEELKGSFYEKQVEVKLPNEFGCRFYILPFQKVNGKWEPAFEIAPK